MMWKCSLPLSFGFKSLGLFSDLTKGHFRGFFTSSQKIRGLVAMLTTILALYLISIKDQLVYSESKCQKTKNILKSLKSGER